MSKQRLRDVAIGFFLCLALVISYQCGAASPTNAAAAAGTDDYIAVGGVAEGGSFAYAVIDRSTGRIVFSGHVATVALGDFIRPVDRYW
jgi:hypothetical protein